MGWIARLGAKLLGTKVADDETPWCGTFMAQVMTQVGLAAPPIAVRASSWGEWGRQLLAPRLGCVLVFKRNGGGHVGLYLGETKTAYRVLGGNQGNMVSETWIAKNRLAPGGMRWPFGVELPPAKPVNLAADGTAISRNEA
tara:strand:+ start:1278 stop:1700 length:423 start_codon:yes stop_codon:yes gene_type:complete